MLISIYWTLWYPKTFLQCHWKVSSFPWHHVHPNCCWLHSIPLHCLWFQCLRYDWSTCPSQLQDMHMEIHLKLHQTSIQIQKLLQSNSRMVYANWMVTWKKQKHRGFRAVLNHSVFFEHTQLAMVKSTIAFFDWKWNSSSEWWEERGALQQSSLI